MSIPSREGLILIQPAARTRDPRVPPQTGTPLMNWQGKQPATGQHGDNEPYVCNGGYLHEFEDGRVECPLCGRGAYSRNEDAIRQWENAHDRCCPRRAV